VSEPVARTIENHRASNDQGGHGGRGEDRQEPVQSVSSQEKRPGPRRSLGRRTAARPCPPRLAPRAPLGREPGQDRLDLAALYHARAPIENHRDQRHDNQLPQAHHGPSTPRSRIRTRHSAADRGMRTISREGAARAEYHPTMVCYVPRTKSKRTTTRWEYVELMGGPTDRLQPRPRRLDRDDAGRGSLSLSYRPRGRCQMNLKRKNGLGETRTPTSFRTSAPKTDASAVPPRGPLSSLHSTCVTSLETTSSGPGAKKRGGRV
jgi:hypothetical protein